MLYFIRFLSSELALEPAQQMKDTFPQIGPVISKCPPQSPPRGACSSGQQRESGARRDVRRLHRCALVQKRPGPRGNRRTEPEGRPRGAVGLPGDKGRDDQAKRRREREKRGGGGARRHVRSECTPTKSVRVSGGS